MSSSDFIREMMEGNLQAAVIRFRDGHHELFPYRGHSGYFTEEEVAIMGPRQLTKVDESNFRDITITAAEFIRSNLPNLRADHVLALQELLVDDTISHVNPHYNYRAPRYGVFQPEQEAAAEQFRESYEAESVYAPPNALYLMYLIGEDKGNRNVRWHFRTHNKKSLLEYVDRLYGHFGLA